MRSGDVVQEIKDEDVSHFNFSTAEGRADFDDFLRALITSKTGEDDILRRHVGEMIKEWRKELFEGQGE